MRAGQTGQGIGGPVVIFDCNGVLIDSEPLATAIVSQEFIRAGFALTPDIVARYFTGRRQSDMFAEVEIAAGRKLPKDFATTVANATMRRFRTELRATAHAAHALSWLRGPKCVASSATLDRMRVSLEATDLIRYFEPHLFSATDVPNGKPSAVGVAAGVAAGMTVIGFAGGSHSGGKLGLHLSAAGARTVISDMRALKGTIVDIRGW